MRELERKELKTLNICNEKYLLSITYDDRMIFQKKIQQEIIFIENIIFEKNLIEYEVQGNDNNIVNPSDGNFEQDYSKLNQNNFENFFCNINDNFNEDKMKA